MLSQNKAPSNLLQKKKKERLEAEEQFPSSSLNLGRVIADGLKKKGWSQKKLAEFLHVTPASVCEWLSGKKVQRWEGFIRLIRALDLVEALFPGYQKILKSVDMSYDIRQKVKELEAKVSSIEEDLRQMRGDAGLDEMIACLVDCKAKFRDKLNSQSSTEPVPHTLSSSHQQPSPKIEGM